MLSADVGEDAECHAAKLLEVILLQCPGQVDSVSTLSPVDWIILYNVYGIFTKYTVNILEKLNVKTLIIYRFSGDNVATTASVCSSLYAHIN